jgi:hypothetical protein
MFAGVAGMEASVVRATDEVRQSRVVAEAAFAFLLDELGYRRCLRRFWYGGFQLGYCGPGTGVLIEQDPRDGLLVWVVLLADGRFPPRWPDLPRRYFGLWDVEAVTGAPSVATADVHTADEPTMRALAGSLRACGASLLRVDLRLIPALERQIEDRARQYQPRWSDEGNTPSQDPRRSG